MRPVTEQAVEVIPAAGYLSPSWYEARRGAVAASEVAAIMGLSPSGWSSAFDLWHLKKSGIDSQPENADMRRGKRFESLILDEFNEDHPEFHLRSVGLCANDERPWQVCTPDALAYETDQYPQLGKVPTDYYPVALVDAKSGARRDEWGQEGTDDIPVHYRCQMLWGLDTLGLSVAYVPVLFGFDFRVYVVEYHEADVKLMREAAERFLDDLAHNREPDIDATRATSRRLKLLHPTLTDDEVEIPPTWLRQYQRARNLRNKAEERMALAENRIRDLLGSAAIGTVDGKKRVSRSIYDLAERTMSACTVDKINFPRKEIP